MREWLDNMKDDINTHGYIYSHFGRKRRLPEAKIPVLDRGSQSYKSVGRGGWEKHHHNTQAQSHGVRSGINFLVQSAASDINLIGAMEAHAIIEQKNMKSKMFALVHDSVLAEVPLDEIDEYCKILQEQIQKDRGIYISGAPVGCDFEIGEDYSMGKFSEKYGSIFNV